MATFDVTKKLSIYHTLYRLNRSFANIVAHCRVFEESGIFKPGITRRYQGYAQELQAEINQELLETMKGAELDDWNRYGKVRRAREKELQDPHDALIPAKERRRELGKSARRGKGRLPKLPRLP